MNFKNWVILDTMRTLKWENADLSYLQLYP